MTLSLPVTVVLLALSFGLFGFASWRARQPSDPLKVRMINYTYVQLVAILLILLMAAHLLSFFGIETGRRGMP